MNGIVLIDKPTGCTSHDVVRTARKVLGTKKVGHAGTLDPFASGLLILLVGQGTKLSDYVLNGDKGYEAEVLFGKETDSYDVTGNVVREAVPDFSDGEFQGALRQLSGDVQLAVPSYSAVKVDGKKLYEYARKGEEAPVIIRDSHFYDVELLERSENTCRVALKCSKGSYIRAWAHELGQKLKCGAILTGLRRTWSQPFSIEQAISMESFEMGEFDPEPGVGFLNMVEALPEMEILEVEGFDENLLLNGQVSKGLRSDILRRVSGNAAFSGVYRVISRSDQRLLALLSSSAEKGLEILRVFPRN